MKKTFILFATLLGFAACTKDDATLAQPQSNLRAGQPAIVDSLDYTFDFTCPSQNVQETRLHPYLVLLDMNNTTQIGRVFFYRHGLNCFTVHLRWDGTHPSGFITGAINGHTFIGYDNYLNVCGGAQQVYYTYRLRNGFGKTVDTNDY